MTNILGRMEKARETVSYSSWVLKPRVHLFLEFSIFCIWTAVDRRQWELGKVRPWLREDYSNPSTGSMAVDSSRVSSLGVLSLLGQKPQVLRPGHWLHWLY